MNTVHVDFGKNPPECSQELKVCVCGRRSHGAGWDDYYTTPVSSFRDGSIPHHIVAGATANGDHDYTISVVLTLPKDIPQSVKLYLRYKPYVFFSPQPIVLQVNGKPVRSFCAALHSSQRAFYNDLNDPAGWETDILDVTSFMQVGENWISLYEEPYKWSHPRYYGHSLMGINFLNIECVYSPFAF